MSKAMTVGELLDTLAALHTAGEDIDPPMSDEEWRAMEIVVRGADEDGNDFCGALSDVSIEEAHGGDEQLFLALDASNEPDGNTPAQLTKVAELVVALEAALGLADVPERDQDEQWYARRKVLGELCERHEVACPPDAIAAARSAS